MQKRLKQSVSTFIFVSILLHISSFLTLILLNRTQSANQPDQVEVEYLSADELTPPEPELVPKKRKKDDRKQIVEQQKQINDELDEKTNLLSAFNQTVERQTVADRAGEFKNTAMGGNPDEGTPDGKKDEKFPDKKALSKRAKGELPDLTALIPRYSLTPGPRAPKFDENGDPSQTEDYLKDKNKGMQTLLSTREFVYYSYYARIKDSLRQHWEPTVREKVKIIYRQGRSIASANDRVTQVLVTLSPKGDLLKAEILGPSGVEALDAAAIEAFRDAAPFPNPPKGMVESDGTIKIRWDFVLEV